LFALLKKRTETTIDTADIPLDAAKNSNGNSTGIHSQLFVAVQMADDVFMM
jgi:hypothetical protein